MRLVCEFFERFQKHLEDMDAFQPERESFWIDEIVIRAEMCLMNHADPSLEGIQEPLTMKRTHF